LKEITFTE